MDDFAQECGHFSVSLALQVFRLSAKQAPN